MADLIAQGSQPQFRWRRHLPAGAPQVLGRVGGQLATPWDERISRKHAELTWQEGRLQVRLLPEARNHHERALAIARDLRHKHLSAG